MTEAEAYVAFNLTEQVGSVKVERLVAEHGSVAAAWESYDRKCSRAGGEVDWRGEFAKAKRYGVRILTPADGEYPKIFHDAPGRPLALYVKGDVAALSKGAIAIVGTRRATPYGLDQARKFAEGLAADGWAIVSGLALGIDAAAHEGALAAGGVTVGVLGSALDCFYPEENRELARRMVAAGGAVVSEFPFGRKPDTTTFPQRNHVVAALARGVLAVEAPFKSGTLITIGIAADLGRTVMAVPGRVDSRSSAGCLKLLRDGARLVRNVRDVEEDMSELFPSRNASAARGGGARAGGGNAPHASPQSDAAPKASVPPPPPFSLEESMVMRNVTPEGVTMDELVEATGLSPAKVNSLCVTLRMKGRLRFFPGNRVATPREP